MKKILLLLLFVFSSLFINVWNTYACSCMLPKHPLEAIDETDKVFIGEVKEVKEISKIFDFWDVKYNEISFDIIYNVKESPEESVKIITAKDSAACWVDFELNKKYIVYAYLDSDNNEYSVSLCSRTANIDYAIEDLQSLNLTPAQLGIQSWTWNIEPSIGTWSLDNNNSVNEYSNIDRKNIYIWIALTIFAISLIIVWFRIMRN